MKLNKIITLALLLLPALLLQSCLKDQEDLFDSSASARVEKYLSDTQKTLQNAQYGWVLENFPDPNQKYGGYTYTLKSSLLIPTTSNYMILLPLTATAM